MPRDHPARPDAAADSRNTDAPCDHPPGLRARGVHRAVPRGRTRGAAGAQRRGDAGHAERGTDAAAADRGGRLRPVPRRAPLARRRLRAGRLPGRRQVPRQSRRGAPAAALLRRLPRRHRRLCDVVRRGKRARRRTAALAPGREPPLALPPCRRAADVRKPVAARRDLPVDAGPRRTAAALRAAGSEAARDSAAGRQRRNLAGAAHPPDGHARPARDRSRSDRDPVRKQRLAPRRRAHGAPGDRPCAGRGPPAAARRAARPGYGRATAAGVRRCRPGDARGPAERSARLSGRCRRVRPAGGLRPPAHGGARRHGRGVAADRRRALGRGGAGARARLRYGRAAARRRGACRGDRQADGARTARAHGNRRPRGGAAVQLGGDDAEGRAALSRPPGRDGSRPRPGRGSSGPDPASSAGAARAAAAARSPRPAAARSATVSPAHRPAACTRGSRT